MARKSADWAAFKATGKGFDFSGDKLKKAWPKLHAGDGEPWPDAARATKLLESMGKPAAKAEAAALGEALVEAWRSFHQGDFFDAFQRGKALGAPGASVACKAIAIHAAYLVDDEDEQLARFKLAAELAEDAVAALPDQANSHYRHAHALGRYSQGISIAKALKMGLAGKVRKSLETTLKLSPKHAEAHTAMALYHAEIIDKVGSMIGGLTYGAKAAAADKHIAQALKLTPDAPIVHVEHGNLLLLLHGDEREDDAAEAFETAAQLKARDAMEQLDARHAAAQIE